MSLAYASSPDNGFRAPAGELNLNEKSWLEYKLKFEKRYNLAEDKVRFLSFLEKLDLVKNYNEGSTMKMALNQFSDWTNDEFLAYNKLGFNQDETLTSDYPASSSEFECPQKFEDYLKFHDYPEVKSEFENALDWRNADLNPMNLVADVGVKDQGQCGSCYAFSAVAVMEGSLCYNGHFNCSSWEGLSEQNVVDCGTNWGLKGDQPWYNFNGCFGGWQSNVFQYVYYTDGISCGAKYPYESGDTKIRGECRYDESMNHGFPDKSICGTVNRHGWRSSEDPMEDTSSLMKKAMYFKGPLTVAMYVNGSFMSYGEGVYTAEDAEVDLCGEAAGANHALTAVGYGVYDDFSAEGHVIIPYWIIKNSWSAGWGDAGYIKVEMGKNVCGVEDNVMYVNMKPGPEEEELEL